MSLKSSLYLSLLVSTKSKAFLYCLAALWCSDTICLAWGGLGWLEGVCDGADGCGIFGDETVLVVALVAHLLGRGAGDGDGGLGEGGVDRPVGGAGQAGAGEVVLVVQLALPLLLGHDGVMVAVVIQQLVARLQASGCRR